MGIKDLKNKIELSPISIDDSPIRAVFCLKKKTDNMKKIEEVEDCFILDFDPFEPPEFSSISPSKNSNRCENNDVDLSVLAEKGQVACRDYPHSRHLCVKFPFKITPHESHCNMCYCYVCDEAAPCKGWTNGIGKKHCDATSDDRVWRVLRATHRKGLIPS